MKLWSHRVGLFSLALSLGLFSAPRASIHAAQATAGELARTATPPQPDRPTAQPTAQPVLSAGGPGTPTAAPGAVAPPPTPPPVMRTFHDPAYPISFDYPANWTFSQRDGEISTFHLDARSATRKTSLRAVAALPSNPFPASTFSGGYVYFSVTPHSNASRCAAQAGPAHKTKPATSQIAGLPFAHGHDEQKDICTVERDEIYTTLHKGACYRFDLAMNNFCGGEVSGVKDVTPQELDSVLARLHSVVETVRFDPK